MGRNCPLCGTWIQRTEHGTINDGMAAHYRVVHLGKTPPVWRHEDG